MDTPIQEHLAAIRDACDRIDREINPVYTAGESDTPENVVVDGALLTIRSRVTELADTAVDALSEAQHQEVMRVKEAAR